MRPLSRVWTRGERRKRKAGRTTQDGGCARHAGTAGDEAGRQARAHKHTPVGRDRGRIRGGRILNCKSIIASLRACAVCSLLARARGGVGGRRHAKPMPPPPMPPAAGGGSKFAVRVLVGSTNPVKVSYRKGSAREQASTRLAGRGRTCTCCWPAPPALLRCAPRVHRGRWNAGPRVRDAAPRHATQRNSQARARARSLISRQRRTIPFKPSAA